MRCRCGRAAGSAPLGWPCLVKKEKGPATGASERAARPPPWPGPHRRGVGAARQQRRPGTVCAAAVSRQKPRRPRKHETPHERAAGRHVGAPHDRRAAATPPPGRSWPSPAHRRGRRSRRAATSATLPPWGRRRKRPTRPARSHRRRAKGAAKTAASISAPATVCGPCGARAAPEQRTVTRAGCGTVASTTAVLDYLNKQNRPYSASEPPAARMPGAQQWPPRMPGIASCRARAIRS